MKSLLILIVLGLLTFNSFGLEPDKKTVKGMWSSTVATEYCKGENGKKDYSYEFESTLSLLNNTFIWDGMDLSGMFSIEEKGKTLVFVDGDHNNTVTTTWHIKKLTKNKLVIYRVQEREGCEYKVQIEFEKV